jgi:hypothetical protein
LPIELKPEIGSYDLLNNDGDFDPMEELLGLTVRR